MADKNTSWMNPVGSIVGDVINTVGQAIQNKKNREFESQEAEKQRLWNESMMDKQNQWSLDMWNRTNEYNTPDAQMQRLRDAGLNPLFYGLDGSSADAMSSAQALGYDRASIPNMPNPYSALGDSALKFAQIANIEANTQKVQSETKAIESKLPFEVDSLKSQIRNSNLSADAQETVNKYIDAQQNAEIRMKNSTADAQDAVVQKAYAEIEKMDYEKTTMYISWLETYEKILNLQKQRELTDKQIDELASLISVNNATAKKIGLDVQNYDDITVIGTASHSMHFGPFSVQQGDPITLAMKKAAQAHADELKEKSKKKKSPNGQVSATDGSPYTGPVYD